MLLHVRATFDIGHLFEPIPTKPAELRSFTVMVGTTEATVSFVDQSTLAARGSSEVSEELYLKLDADDYDSIGWPQQLADEAKAFVSIPDTAFIRVYNVLKFILRHFQLKDRPRPDNWEWSSDGTNWRRFILTSKLVSGRGWMPTMFDATLHQRMQDFLSKDRPLFLDAFRHLHRAQNERNPRYMWIDATIAAELAIKEFLILYKPELETLLLDVPSPPLHKLYVTCFRFFGQVILLFWTAQGELSDVEERFREAG